MEWSGKNYFFLVSGYFSIEKTICLGDTEKPSCFASAVNLLNIASDVFGECRVCAPSIMNN